MELQFNKTVCPCLRRAAWEVQNQEQTQEVRLPDAMPDIGRVLGAWGQTLVRSKEWRGNGMSVSGGVMAWVLYTPEDGSEPRSVETWIPFQMKWDFPDTERDGAIAVSCLLRSVDARSVSARKLMVRAGVGVLGEALEPTEAEIYAPGELPEDIQVLRKSYPIRLPREAGEKTFLLDEDLVLPGSCPPAEKLIRYELQPEIVDQKVMAGKVVFRGTGLLHILYRGEDGQFHSWDFEVPFSQYTDLEREYDQDATARVVPAVTSLELEPEEEGHFHLKAGLTGQYTVLDRVMVEIVEDAYSPNRTVTPRFQQLQLPMVLDDHRETLRAEQSMDAEGNRIVDVTFSPDHPRQQRRGDGVEMEIPGSFQILYYDGDGKLQSGSAKWEGNWTLPAGENGRVEATAWPSGRPQASMGSGTATARGDVLVDAVTTADKGLPMVTSLEIGEMTEPDPNRPSLILRKAGEDRLWDMAKGYGSTVEAIREANGLQDEPDAEQMLLIPIS